MNTYESTDDHDYIQYVRLLQQNVVDVVDAFLIFLLTLVLGKISCCAQVLLCRCHEHLIRHRYGDGTQ